MKELAEMAEKFVVVAGSPRSGTSLLRTFLTRSAALCVHKTEPHYVIDLYQRHGRTITDVKGAADFLLSHEKFPAAEVGEAELRKALEGRTSISLSELLRTCYRLLNREHPERPVVLKHPGFILHLDLIKDLFPGVFVIHSIRDPRANAHSQRTRWPSTSLWDAASRWRSSVRAGREWQARRATPYLEIRYEDLVTEPDATCATICGFLGIPFDQAMLAFDHVEREWNPANPGEGAKRHYQGFEKQRIDKWKKYMAPAEVKLIEDRCRDGMALFDYELMNPQVDVSAYVPYYLKERQKALKKSVKRMRKRLRLRVGAS
jgi:hypothetical protein